MKTLDPVVHRVRKEFILSQARHLFAIRGLSETSMDDIARRCKIQKASLYHYFDSKQQILQEVVNMECARWNERVSEYATGKTLKETLEQIARTFIADMDTPDRREFFTLIHFESHKNPSILKALKESPTYNREGFYSVFAKHWGSRISRTKGAIFMAQFMGALIHYVTLTRLRGQNMCLEPMKDETYVDQLVTVFSNALSVI